MLHKFTGYPSGDGECFCFAVDFETFVRINNRRPEWHDSNPYHTGMFNLYPRTLFSQIYDNPPKLEIKIEVNSCEK